MNISIFGLGYVGCVSLGCLAKNGHNVVGVDVSQTKVDLINSGKPTIIEKDIDSIIAEQFAAGRISATRDFADAVRQTEVSIICVGTPSSPDGHLNLDYIFTTARQIGEGMKDKDGFHVVAIRSTVMPGTNQKVGEIIEEASGKKRNEGFAMVSNPEFLREGTAVSDYYKPPVTVIGSDSERGLDIMSEIYSAVEAPIERTEVEVAEMIKYVNNSFHALKITFANEVGNIAKKLGIDSHKVMELFCKDTHLNLSPYYLKPGFAYGGSCLPKDLKGLRTLAHDLYLVSPVIDAVEASNENQKRIAFEMITNAGSKKVGILGLSFKEGTDDLRYSPIVEVTERLLGKGYQVRIFDRNVNLSKLVGANREYIDHHLPHLADLITDDLDSVIGDSEVLVVSHKNAEFREPLRQIVDKPIIDLVRLFETTDQPNYQGICW